MRTPCLLRGGLLAAAAFVDIVSAGDTSGEAAARCCSKLVTALPHRVLKPDTADYKHVNSQYWSTTAILSPKCIVRPANVAGVSTIIKILTAEATSDLPACPFAIKSGGHMPIPGANNIDKGIVVDLSEIDGVLLSPNRKILGVETGSTWQEAANELNGTDRGIPSGRDPTTAVGGFTLGGGISFFAPKIGFGADNVVNFEVVLASGDIVNANATSNSDLWMALKGGGSNFGIVTRFDFNTFPLRHLWSAGIPLPVDEHTTEFALNALHGLTQIHRAFPNLAYGNTFSFNASRTPPEGSIWNSAVFSGNEIRELHIPSVPVTVGGVKTEVSIMDHMSETSLADLLKASNRFPFGYRKFMATVTFVNDWTTLSHVHELTVDLYKTVRHVENMEWLFAYESIPHLYTEHSVSRGGNVLGLNRTKEDLILMHLAPRWSSTSDDKVMFNMARQWVEQVKGYTKSVGTSSDYVYLNYAGSFQDPIASYGEDSVRFLKQVARKYDPSGVFQKAAKGGFKIPGMDKSGDIEHDEL